jgi:type IV pilus assembly protein PilW
LTLDNQSGNNNWPAQPTNGIQGFDSVATDVGDSNTYARQTGTDSFTVWSANANPMAQVISVGVAPGGTRFSLDKPVNLAVGSLAVVCNYGAEVLFTVSTISGNTITTNVPIQTLQVFGPGSLITALEANHWYISNKTIPTNGSLNNLSLRRSTLSANRAPSLEIVENVSDMQITYLAGDANGRPTASTYVDATRINNWSQVLAVRITLTLTSPEAIAVGAGGAASAETYQVPITAAIRSRLP